MIGLVVLIVAVACRVSLPASDSALRTVVTNVHVVDVRDGRVDSNRSIVIDGGTITAVVAAGHEPRGVVRIDNLRGAFVIPGLWDMHVHLGRSGRSALGLCGLHCRDARRLREDPE